MEDSADENENCALSSPWSDSTCSPPEAKKSKQSDDSIAAAASDAVTVISSTTVIADSTAAADTNNVPYSYILDNVLKHLIAEFAKKANVEMYQNGNDPRYLSVRI